MSSKASIWGRLRGAAVPIPSAPHAYTLGTGCLGTVMIKGHGELSLATARQEFPILGGPSPISAP
ncbi:hypothetical protein CUC53_17150 [Aeromonas cavernicola]|uniref:Uncharacterized protein n=1 Tax=Aeromonas cavernicola TaxID=1006623 RepID=A0A2H9U0Q3_9GAMM|nr:hypothetical protein CUC53_17150 [Aeromonas cavernicola]